MILTPGLKPIFLLSPKDKSSKGEPTDPLGQYLRKKTQQAKPKQAVPANQQMAPVAKQPVPTNKKNEPRKERHKIEPYYRVKDYKPEALIKTPRTPVDTFTLQSCAEPEKKEELKGLLLSLSPEAHKNDCFILGSLLIRLLDSRYGHSYDIEVLNPQGLEIKVDDQGLGTHEHLLLRNIDINSMVHFGDSITITNSEQRFSRNANFKFVIDADRAINISMYSTRNSGPHATSSKKYFGFYNSDQALVENLDEYKVSVEYSGFNENKIELTVRDKDALRNAAEKKISFEGTGDSVKLDDFGIEIKMVNNIEFTDEIKTSQFEVEKLG